MSIEVLKDTLRLVDCEDGLKRIKKRKLSKKLEDRQRLRKQLKSLILAGDVQINDDDVDVDNVFVTRRRKCNYSYLDRMVPETSIKNGLSLLEEYRKRKSNVNLFKRNLRYMKFNNEKKLEGKKMEKLINMLEEDKCIDERMKIRKLRAELDGLREPKLAKAKEESQSFFSDKDFMKVGEGRIKLLGKKKSGKDDEGENDYMIL
uniref:rRNA-processing protein EFG1 n=1 Tax=Syphacia muris TaxID=451379 RepID=A0A0N5ADJ4_9BILA